MQMRSLVRTLACAAGVAVLAFSGAASADPPSRVARLGYMAGAVSFSPAGENDWVHASVNRPLTTGDRLWADRDARAEIQVGAAMLRMNAGTSVSILNLNDQIAQLQLTQGTLTIRVRRLDRGQVFEVGTPNLAFVVRRPGEYRIEVDADDDATTIVVRSGEAEVYGDDTSYVVDARQPYRFWGTGLREYEYVEAPRRDEFDRWSSERDRRYESSVSARYVSPDVIGYHDLDANGTWRIDATYGNVWFPSRVQAGWAPYRDGHWAWIDPWGWTWVDDAPWGFAVSHYGRWANLRGTWGWVPGPVQTRAYYAPALVVFVGGANFRLTISSGNVGGVAWFPLAPREVYQPAYPVSRSYFENVNRSNTVINNTVINNTYNNINVTNTVYVNRQVPGAVVAVPTSAFVQSQPVSRAAVQVSRDMIVSAPLVIVAPVAPTERSVRGAAPQADRPPPARAFERPVVARTAPPAAPVGFAAQQPQLATQPGKPLDESARRQLKPAAAAPVPAVKLVAPTREAAPTQRLPQAAARGRSDERKVATTPAITGVPGAPPAGAAPAQATTPTPAGQPPEPRGNAEQRVQPAAPPPAAPQPAAKRPAAPPVAEAAPIAQPPEQLGKSEPRGKAEQRVQPAAPPPALPQGAAEPPAAAEQVVPPTPAAQQRPKPESAPATKPAERRPTAAAPASPPPPQKARPRGQEPEPAASKDEDKKKDRDERKRDEEERRQRP